MTLEQALATANPFLVLIVGWFVRNWASEMREHRTRDCLRLQALEKDVAFIKGQLRGVPDDHSPS